jgi:putative spermidine/putrescine transport system permease protein
VRTEAAAAAVADMLSDQSSAAARPTPRRRRFRSAWTWVVFVLAIAYFVVPLYGSGVFAFSTGKAFSIQPLFDALGNPGFQASLILSVTYALITTFLSVVIVAPTAYLIALRFPGLRATMEFISILPFVIPAIILTLGLEEVYGIRSPINLLASQWAPALLIFGYVILALPFVYRAVDNALRAVDVRSLAEASAILGAGSFETYLRVIVPSIWVGLVSAALLSFTTAMGEFTLASLLGFATFPVFLENLNGFEPRATSALVLVSFAITWAGVLALTAVARRAPGSRVVRGAQ